jgi:hypothetical protein
MCSLAALLAAFHVVTTFARTGKRGRPRQPNGEPHPELIYGQLVKQKKHGTLLTLHTRIVLGAVGAPNVQLLQRPGAPAAARGLLPGLLQCGQTAYEPAAAVAAARAHTARRDAAPMAAVYVSDGGRPDGSRLDFS